MLFDMFYRCRNVKFLGQWSNFVVMWGSGHSGNNYPVSSPVFFLIYFLGASLVVPIQRPLLFTSLHLYQTTAFVVLAEGALRQKTKLLFPLSLLISLQRGQGFKGSCYTSFLEQKDSFQ